MLHLSRRSASKVSHKVVPLTASTLRDELLDGARQSRLEVDELGPRRLAYVAKDGTPRAIPIAFTWNGREVVTPESHGQNYSYTDAAERPTVDEALTADSAPWCKHHHGGKGTGHG